MDKKSVPYPKEVQEKIQLPTGLRGGIPVVSPTSQFANDQFANVYFFVWLGSGDERTRNKLYGVWMKERGISCMALSVGFTYLAACLARQWIKERGIIDMRVRAKSGPLFCSLATLVN